MRTLAEPRDSGQLLVLYRDSSKVEHRNFRDVSDYLTREKWNDNEG